MKTVRISISLPSPIAKKLKSNYKPRQRSKIIAEALESYFERDFSKSLMEEMVEGYVKNRNEDFRLSKEADVTLIDGI